LPCSKSKNHAQGFQEQIRCREYRLKRRNAEELGWAICLIFKNVWEDGIERRRSRSQKMAEKMLHKRVGTRTQFGTFLLFVSPILQLCTLCSSEDNNEHQIWKNSLGKEEINSGCSEAVRLRHKNEPIEGEAPVPRVDSLGSRSEGCKKKGAGSDCAGGSSSAAGNK